MRRILLIALLLCGVASASDFYYAATSAGSNNGTSCSNAYAYNDGTNGWNVSAKQAAGNTLHSCGAFTFGNGANPLTFVNSGSSGNPITLKFESGSTWTAPYFAGGGGAGGAAIVMDGQSFITITGTAVCGWVAHAEVTCTEYIQNNNNGTSLTFQNPSVAFSYFGSNNVTIEDLGIFNIYVRTNTTDQTSQVFCGLGYGNTFLVQNTTAHDLDWCWQESPNASHSVSGEEFKNNVVYHMDHGFVLNANNSGGNISTSNIHDNECRDFSLWDDTSGADSFHHDCVHTYANSGGGTLSGINIYNMTGGGAWGSKANAFIYMEGTLSTYYVFNNYLAPSDAATDDFASGYIGIIKNSTGTCSGINVLNNTLVSANNTNAGNPGMLNSPNGAPNCTNIVWENNIIVDLYTLINDATTGGTKTSNNNVFWNFNNTGGGDPFKWNNVFYATFASYQSGSSQDAASVITNPNLNSNGTLQSGSSAIGLAINYHSTCNGQPTPGLGALCSDYTGAARPSSGAWDSGAYEYSASSTSGDSLTGVTVQGSVIQ